MITGIRRHSYHSARYNSNGPRSRISSWHAEFFFAVYGSLDRAFAFPIFEIVILDD